jgi:hypothetical protein
MLIPATNMIHPHTPYFEAHDELLLSPLKVVPRARAHLRTVTAANSRPLYSQLVRHATLLPLQASPVGLRAV